MRNSQKYMIERNGVKYSVLDGFKIKDNFSKIKNVESILIKRGQMTEPPVVSIVVPTFKRIDTLKETLQSCYNQKTDIPFNIIIVDSNAERNDVTEQYVKTIEDSRVSYYKYSRSVTAIDNRNRCFELCEAEYALMVHDDDILYPNFVQTMVGFMLKYPDIDILYPRKDDWYYFEGQEMPQEQRNGTPHLYRLTTCDFADTNEGFTTGFVTKRNIILKLGGWDETYSPSSDWVFNVKAIINGIKVYKYNQPMFAYRYANNDTRNVKTRIRFLQTNPQVICAICKCNIISRIFQEPLLRDYYYWERYEIQRQISDIDTYSQNKKILESLIHIEGTNYEAKKIAISMKLWRYWLKFLHKCNRIF